MYLEADQARAIVDSAGAGEAFEARVYHVALQLKCSPRQIFRIVRSGAKTKGAVAVRLASLAGIAAVNQNEPTIPPRKKVAPREWQDMDWSQSNAQLAQKMNVSRQYADQLRKQFAPVKYRRRAATCAAEFSGERLAEQRRKHQLSQRELAERIECKKIDLIRQWEKGERTPGANYILRLLIVLGASPTDLTEQD